MKPVTDWQARYNSKNIGWDIGYVSTPIKEYIDQLEDKSLRILIPGAGNAYEAEYLWNKGFKNTFILDLAKAPLNNFVTKNPEFPKDQLIQGNFFEHHSQYDLILEQTFFCAINPVDRKLYAEHTAKNLKTAGKLVGLLWSVPMNKNQPPFGGNEKEYRDYFEPFYSSVKMEEAYNSIPQRAKRELFFIARK